MDLECSNLELVRFSPIFAPTPTPLPSSLTCIGAIMYWCPVDISCHGTGVQAESDPLQTANHHGNYDCPHFPVCNCWHNLVRLNTTKVLSASQRPDTIDSSRLAWPVRVPARALELFVVLSRRPRRMYLVQCPLPE